MGFDLSEFYEIYGHDLEVEARQERRRFQQRPLGWVQTWNNTLCSLYRHRCKPCPCPGARGLASGRPGPPSRPLLEPRWRPGGQPMEPP